MRNARFGNIRSAATHLDQQTFLDKRFQRLAHRTARNPKHAHKLVFRRNLASGGPLLGKYPLSHNLGKLQIDRIFRLEYGKVNRISRRSVLRMKQRRTACNGFMNIKICSQFDRLPVVYFLYNITHGIA